MLNGRAAALTAAVLIASAITAAHGGTPPAPPTFATTVGRQAPDFTVQALDGRSVTLAELRGGDALYLQFFADYCIECRAEVPLLNRVHESLGGRGLRVVGINFGEGRAEAERFARRTSPAYPLFLDPAGAAAKAFNVPFVPMNVLIDRAGVVRYQEVVPPADAATSLGRFLDTGELAPPAGVIGRLGEWLRRLLTSRSPWGLPVAFVGGVLSALLPCVYPVIPVAAAFFAAQAGHSRRRSLLMALAYGLGMALLVTLLGFIAVTAGTSIGQLASNPWMNVGVGVAIVVLALAVAEVIHVRPPEALGRAQGRAAALSGLPAAFLLGLVSGPVVSVCVAPILGAILLAIIAGQVGLAYGTLLVFLYGLGLALPFVLLGTFTGLLKSLPKPGRWMRAVQLGFSVLLALVGLYFILFRGLARLG
jgi:cytochrome c biogenesis protein CcdA/peroxiredoxin